MVEVIDYDVLRSQLPFTPVPFDRAHQIFHLRHLVDVQWRLNCGQYQALHLLIVLRTANQYVRTRWNREETNWHPGTLNLKPCPSRFRCLSFVN